MKYSQLLEELREVVDSIEDYLESFKKGEGDFYDFYKIVGKYSKELYNEHNRLYLKKVKENK
jgi:hypothetical protein